MKSPLLLAVFLLAPSIAGAVNYETKTPLSALVRDTPRDCRATTTSSVPTIAWGADIVAYHANGNADASASNSIFAAKGLKVILKRQDRFAEQLSAYIRCDSPFLRGTEGMIAAASDVTERDPRTRIVKIYQLSWSNGGDALVVKDVIRQPTDLKGRTIASSTVPTSTISPGS